MLVTFSHNVFKMLVFHDYLKLGLCGKVLKHFQTISVLIKWCNLSLISAFSPFPPNYFKMFLSTDINPLPNHKILGRSKFKAHADDKINVIQNLNFVLGRVEKILVKGENAGF